MPLFVGTRYALRSGAVWSPASLGNLARWYDASRIAGLSDGDAVSQWDDLSGNAGHISATLTTRPLYKTAIANGLSVVRFDGVNDVLIGTHPLSGDASFSLYAVVSSADSLNHQMLGIGGTGTNQGVILLHNTTVYGFAQYNGTSITGGAISSSMKVLAGVRSPSAMSFFVNGAQQGSTVTPATLSISSTRLAVGGGASASEWQPGDFGEVLLYSAAHDATQRAAVETYLRTKWGTA